jgi:hypothetical protein
MTRRQPASNLQPPETAVDQPQAVDRIVETRHIDGVTYTLEWTRCGKAAAGTCRKCAFRRCRNR